MDRRPDIAKAGDGDGERIHFSLPHDQHETGGQGDQEGVHRDVDQVRRHLLVPEEALAQLHLGDRRRVKGAPDLEADGLEEDQHAVRLDTAGSRARTGAHHAHEDQHHIRQHGPGGVVHGRETRSRGDTHRMEGPVPERLSEGRREALGPRHRRKEEGEEQERCDVEFYDGVVERLEGTVDDGEINQAEMEGRDEHEEHRQALDQVGIIGPDGQVPRTEPTRGADAECVVDGVERRHPGRPIGEERDDDKAEIDESEDTDDLVGRGTVPLLGKGGQLHVGQAQADRARVRNHQQQEDHDTETADEVGRTPPEEQALGNRLDIVQDRRPGRRVTGHTLKPGVLDGKRTAPQGVRQHADDEREQPGKDDDHVTVLHRDGRRPLHEDEGEKADGESDEETDEQGRQRTVVAVRHRYDDGEQHEERTDEQRVTDIPADRFQIHDSLSVSSGRDWAFRRLARRFRNWMFSAASSVMPAFSSDNWSSPSKV